jgi:NAD(P)-dependent dehydrogenase (short-subunit alcohol dehydrogenase family)
LSEGRFAGRTALVTGAGGGLGACIAARLAAEGASLAITDLDPDSLAATATAIRAAGGELVSGVGDVASEQTLAPLVEEAVASFGGLDAVCNVAGISPPIPVAQMTRDDFDRLMHTNCYGQLLAIQQAIPHMLAQGRGSIVNVSSVGAKVALPQLAGYSASKAAVLGLTRGVAYEYGEQGIRCNAICPGGIETPMAAEVVATFADRDEALARLTGRQLSKRFADPAEIASLAVYLLSDEASFVNGATISIDAGHTAW